MNFKKILAGAAASVVAVTSLATFTSAANVVVDEGVFVLGFGDADWKASFWGKEGDTIDSSYAVTSKLEGNGQYTVGIDLTKGYTADGWVDEETGSPINLTSGNGIGAMGVQIYGEYPTLGVNIISVKIDGVEQTITGVSYTNDEDDGRRTNISNEWAGFDASKEDHISKDPDNASSTLIDAASVGEWHRIVVVFEVYGLDYDKEAPDEEDPYTYDDLNNDASGDDNNGDDNTGDNSGDTSGDTDGDTTTTTAATTAATTTSGGSSSGSCSSCGGTNASIVVGVLAVAVVTILFIKKRV